MVVLKLFGWIFGLSAACAAGLAVAFAIRGIAPIEGESLAYTLALLFFGFWWILSSWGMFAGLIATAIALIVSKLIMKRKIGLVFPLSVGSMTVLVICAVVVYVLFG